ncbi:hypothetical protein [Corynebacterium sp.]|uniref:hypothetical protein n=1 Tax=Corynebacterium sp. TaxID=1720 RepID=UPI0028AD76AD|nr:hypothetical protein [Corynebacterium sp.]
MNENFIISAYLQQIQEFIDSLEAIRRRFPRLPQSLLAGVDNSVFEASHYLQRIEALQ